MYWLLLIDTVPVVEQVDWADAVVGWTRQATQATKAINRLWTKGESFTVLLLLRWSSLSPGMRPRIAIDYGAVMLFRELEITRERVSLQKNARMNQVVG